MFGTKSFLWLVLVGVLGMSIPVQCKPSLVRIASTRGEKVYIIAESPHPLMKLTVEWCRRFLIKRGYNVGLTPSPARGDRLEWIFLVSKDCPVTADGYSLTIDDSSPTVVRIVGRNAAGVRSGVVRLVSLMSESNGNLLAPKTCEVRSPFFPIRRIMICPTGRICDGPEGCRYNGLPESSAIWADTLFTNWSDERLKQYAEQLWLMGFNSVETGEIRGYRGVFTDQQLKEQITPKLRVFMKAVRDNGMQVSQFIWGQSLFKEGENLCWNSSEERKSMEAEYRRLAKTYGDLVDHVVVHVGDPGGCDRNGCDPYKTTQEIATCILREYRKVNPNVTVTLSTWANAGFWHGRQGDEFLDESYSPKEIGIALHRWYNPEHANLVRTSGRQCDIWGWYLSDFELSLDMALLMKRLDKMFRTLPEQAGRDIRAMSTEICFHGWPHIINAYVSAQKMWDPKRDLREIEREFCAGVFGDRNADSILMIYEACEAYVHPERFFGFISPDECLPVVFGTPEYNRQCRRALAATRLVELGHDWQPRMTSATDPAILLDYLVQNLSLIRIFSEAYEKMEHIRQSNANADELSHLFDDAVTKAKPYVTDPDYPYLFKTLHQFLEKR